METKESTIWLRSDSDNLAGIVSANAFDNTRKGWLSINCSPISISLELTPEQMSALAFELQVAVRVIEERQTSAAA